MLPGQIGIYALFAAIPSLQDPQEMCLVRREGDGLKIEGLTGMGAGDNVTHSDFEAFKVVNVAGAGLASQGIAFDGIPIIEDPHSNGHLERVVFQREKTDATTGAVISEAVVTLYDAPGGSVSARFRMSPEMYQLITAPGGVLDQLPAPPATTT